MSEAVTSIPEETGDILDERLRRKICYEGEFELLNATWDLRSGRQVELRIVEVPGETGVHPFKQYQKRRGGRVGTRFFATFAEVSTGAVILSGEIQLASWAEGSDKGQSVKFWLDEDPEMHPFAGYKGREGKMQVGEMFMGAFVELDDDNTAIDQKSREAVEKAGYRVSSYAWKLCHMNERFLQWMSEKVQPRGERWTWTPEMAHRFIRKRCGVESLGDLDRDDRAREVFHEQFRKPFARWVGDI